MSPPSPQPAAACKVLPARPGRARGDPTCPRQAELGSMPPCRRGTGARCGAPPALQRPGRRGPYLARGPARSLSSAGRRWSRSLGWTPRPRSSPATRRRGRGSAPPRPPLPHRPPSASPSRWLHARRLAGPSAAGSGSAPGPPRAARPARRGRLRAEPGSGTAAG